MWSLSIRNMYLNLYAYHHRLDGTQESFSPSVGAIVAKTSSVESSVKNIKCQKKKKSCKTESMHILFPRHCDHVE